MSKLESQFQAKLIKRIKKEYPDCMVLKNDPTYIQGVPDLLILNGKHWCALECKRSAKASHRPNQDYYVNKMNKMSYASFIYPENEEEVMNEVQKTFGTRRTTRSV